MPDVWDDIRELTSGYFAGDEALRSKDGAHTHKQQSPIALLLRMVLSSTDPGDCVFDPFCGTGTTLVVASQLGCHSIGVEKDSVNINHIRRRLSHIRLSDSLLKHWAIYSCTPDLNEIWPTKTAIHTQPRLAIS